MASQVFDNLFREACQAQAEVWRDAVRLGEMMPYESAVDLMRTARALHEAGERCLAELERIRNDSAAVGAFRRKIEGRPLSEVSAAVLLLLKGKFPW